MIRCESCRTLNEDNARNCSWCGMSLWLSGRTTGDVKREQVMPKERQPAYTTPPPTPPRTAYAQPPVRTSPNRPQPEQTGYRCPYCHTTAPPFNVQKISEAGWIVFAIMLLFCFPLFWVGLLMQEDQRVCSVCRARLG